MRMLLAAIALFAFATVCEAAPPSDTVVQRTFENFIRKKFPDVSFDVKEFVKVNVVSRKDVHECHYRATTEFPQGLLPPGVDPDDYRNIMIGITARNKLTDLQAKGFRVIDGPKITGRLILRGDWIATYSETPRGWTIDHDY